MSPRLLAAAAAAATLLSGCGLPFFDSPPQYGFISVSAGGQLLVPGSSQVPPTLDLRLHAEQAMRAQDASGTVDARQLSFTQSGSDLVATTAALPLGSSHHLTVTIAGRAQGISIDFSVIPPTSAMLAAHLDPSAGLVVDGVFDDAPAQPAVASALPGASLTWRDPTHVRVTWPTPPAAVDLPAGIPTAHGSHLGWAVHLPLSGLAAGDVRRVTAPPAAAISGTNLVAFVSNTAAGNTSLAQHQSVLDAVAATGWQAQPDGSILGTPDEVAVARAKAARLPVWADMENDFSNPDGTSSLLGSRQAVSSLVSTAVQSVVDGGYAGVNLDFEGMHAADKDAYTAFVKALATGLHAHNAQLMVDVVPHGSGGVNQFSAAYDVPALGGAADLVDIMAYDQHGDGGSPGPVAGLDWVKAELAATTPGLTPGHTVLGVPLYGRTWSSGSGSSVTYSEAIAELQDPGSRVDYDFGAQTPFIVSADGSTVTYFDDADSLARKIGLAHTLGLGGIAAWRLGYEDPSFWTLFG